MKKIIEISRRSIYDEDDGLACGPAGSTAIEAEIVVEMDGQRYYLHGEWVDIAGDYNFEANTESFCAAYEKYMSAANEDEKQKAIDECNRISDGRIADDSIFEPFYAELKQMIHDEMTAHGLEDFIEDEEDEEDPEE